MTANTGYRTHKLGLLAGYSSLIGALFIAHRSSAAGYELSVYAGTPLEIWIAVGLSAVIALLAAVTTQRESRVHGASVYLLALSALIVISMPILRGYHYYGTGDALSHLGWAAEIAEGSLEPTNLLYPGIHTATVLLSSLADISLYLANMYVVIVGFPLIFILFIPLLVQLLANSRAAYLIGLGVAILLTPINNIATHLVAHPSTQAILFAAVVFYLAMAYIVRGYPSQAVQKRVFGVIPLSKSTDLGTVLALSSIGLLLVHPQQALNVGLCFIAITGIQIVRQYRKGDLEISGFRPLDVQTIVIIVAFVVWATRFERVQGAIQSTVLSIISGGATAGNVVTDKSLSITTIGGSLPVLFLKLFLGGLVLSIIAAALIAYGFAGKIRDTKLNVIVIYLTAALVPAMIVFLVVLVAATGDMYFRYHGFIMIIVSVLGASGLTLALTGRWDRELPVTIGKIAIVVLLVVLVPFSLTFLHPSPYIYQPSQHVTEAQISGYSSSFDHRESGVGFAGIRGGPTRYVDLHYGTQEARSTLEFPGYETPIPERVFSAGNYSEYFDGSRYIATSQATYEREVSLYRGFRFSEAGFQNLEQTVGVSRIRTSEGFNLYRVDDR